MPEIEKWFENLYKQQQGETRLEKLISLDILLCRIIENKLRRGEIITENMLVYFYKAMYFLMSEYVVFVPDLYSYLKNEPFSFNNLQLDVITAVSICHLSPWLFHTEIQQQLSLLKTYVESIRVVLRRIIKDRIETLIKDVPAVVPLQYSQIK
jgi:hypothetical protein